MKRCKQEVLDSNLCILIKNKQSKNCMYVFLIVCLRSKHWRLRKEQISKAGWLTTKLLVQ